MSEIKKSFERETAGRREDYENSSEALNSKPHISGIQLWAERILLIVLILLTVLSLLPRSEKHVEKMRAFENMTYTGTLLSNKFSGEGELNFSNGDKYIGGFNEGRFNGNGCYTSASGWSFKGKFTDGKPDPGGIFVVNDKVLWKNEKDGSWIRE